MLYVFDVIIFLFFEKKNLSLFDVVNKSIMIPVFQINFVLSLLRGILETYSEKMDLLNI
jgi:hypothetical protein